MAVAADSPPSATDGKPIFVNDGAISPDGYAVNSMAPPYQPSYVRPAGGGDPRLADPTDPNTLPPQSHKTIGDLRSEKSVSWAWYGGAWQAALEAKGGGRKPNFLNLHAGYSDVESGDQHVANVLEHLKKSPQWKNMLVVITFDENGGWWDHVAPPMGDRWGPGSRVAAIVASPYAKKGAVHHSFYDTTSILRFITRLHDLPHLEGLVTRNAAFAARGALPPGDLTGALSFR